MRKSLKLIYAALDSGNYKQNAPLALPVFHETIIPAFENYYP